MTHSTLIGVAQQRHQRQRRVNRRRLRIARNRMYAMDWLDEEHGDRINRRRSLKERELRFRKRQASRALKFLPESLNESAYRAARLLISKFPAAERKKGLSRTQTAELIVRRSLEAIIPREDITRGITAARNALAAAYQLLKHGVTVPA